MQSMYSISPSRLGLRAFFGVVLPLCRETVDVFYSPSRLDLRAFFGVVLPLYRETVVVFYSPSRLDLRAFFGVVLPLYKETVDVFYSPSRLGLKQSTAYLSMNIVCQSQAFLFHVHKLLKTTRMHTKSMLKHISSTISLIAQNTEQMFLSRAMHRANDCWTDHRLVFSKLHLCLCSKPQNKIMKLLRKFDISKQNLFGLIWFVGFYGVSTFVGYLTPNRFLCKYSVLFKTIQFSINAQFNRQKHFHFKLFKQLYVTIQLSVNTVLMSKNSSISNNSVKHKHAV